jgi:hypothetical protein
MKRRFSNPLVLLAVNILKDLSFVYWKIHNIPSDFSYFSYFDEESINKDIKDGKMFRRGLKECWNQFIYWCAYNCFSNFFDEEYDIEKDLYITAIPKRAFYAFVKLQTPFLWLGGKLQKYGKYGKNYALQMILYDIAAIIDMVTDCWNKVTHDLDKHIVQKIGRFLLDFKLHMHEKILLLFNDIVKLFNKKKKEFEEEIQALIKTSANWAYMINYKVHADPEMIYRDKEAMGIAFSDTLLQIVDNRPDRLSLQKLQRRYFKAETIVKIMDKRLVKAGCYKTQSISTTADPKIAKNDKSNRFLKVKDSGLCNSIVSDTSNMFNQNAAMQIFEMETSDPNFSFIVKFDRSLKILDTTILATWATRAGNWWNRGTGEENTRARAGWATSMVQRHFMISDVVKNVMAVEGVVETPGVEGVVETPEYANVLQQLAKRQTENLFNNLALISGNNSTNFVRRDFLEEGAIWAASYIENMGGTLAKMLASGNDEQEPLDEEDRVLRKFDMLFM